MRHITILAFGGPPCNGLIKYTAPRETTSPTRLAPGRSLPILSNAPPPRDAGEWVCERCGKIWSREPLPEEAL